jgi:hypothetical protein
VDCVTAAHGRNRSKRQADSPRLCFSGVVNTAYAMKLQRKASLSDVFGSARQLSHLSDDILIGCMHVAACTSRQQHAIAGNIIANCMLNATLTLTPFRYHCARSPRIASGLRCTHLAPTVHQHTCGAPTSTDPRPTRVGGAPRLLASLLSHCQHRCRIGLSRHGATDLHGPASYGGDTIGDFGNLKCGGIRAATMLVPVNTTTCKHTHQHA